VVSAWWPCGQPYCLFAFKRATLKAVRHDIDWCCFSSHLSQSFLYPLLQVYTGERHTIVVTHGMATKVHQVLIPSSNQRHAACFVHVTDGLRLSALLSAYRQPDNLTLLNRWWTRRRTSRTSA
jgi:hypothetical protein